MSDVPEGPDWWQASDDKWYPGPQPPTPGVEEVTTVVPAQEGTVANDSEGQADQADGATPVDGTPVDGTPGRRHARTALAAVLGGLAVAATLGLVTRGGSGDNETAGPTTTGQPSGAASGADTPDASDATGPLAQASATTDASPQASTDLPPAPSPTTAPPTAPPTSATTQPPPPPGVSAVVDASASRWQDDQCTWQGHENTRPFYGAPPTEACSQAAGYLAHGVTVRLVCAARGLEITDAQGYTSSIWVRVLNVTNNLPTGYMNTLYFTSPWNSDPAAQLPDC